MFQLFAPRAVRLRDMEKREIDGNQATGVLKIIALVFMFCDHAGKMLLPNVPEMRVIGRIAFPIYCWCLVVGFHYTRRTWLYLLRLVLVGLISQPLYVLALNHKWTEPNIMLTLAVALCGLWAIRQKTFLSHIWGPLLALVAAELLGCSYGWKGVMIVYLLYAAQESRWGIAGVMLAFCLYWGIGSATITRFCGIDLVAATKSKPWSSLLSPWLKLQAMAVLSLPFLVIRFPKNLRMPVWIGYAIYPGHLALLWWLELILAK
ncbi:MAG: hypothetical protein IKP10_07670 [Clostridia bacterium]|nr:hypothetical protein [Clostridia bacterium]